jgi:hypothetical protein
MDRKDVLRLPRPAPSELGIAQREKREREKRELY